MVYQDSIPFGAPSQRRLHMVADGSGTAYLAVLNAFNEPEGNLKSLRASLDELVKFDQTGETTVRAENERAHITFSPGVDSSHVTHTVEYEDTVTGTKSKNTITKEDFHDLVENARTKAGAATV